MVYVVTGLVFILIGSANLLTGRLHPDRPNARLSKGLGYVGIVCGVLTLLGGIAQVAGFGPPPVPPAQP
jgi:hypothetical protein